MKNTYKAQNQRIIYKTLKRIDSMINFLRFWLVNLVFINHYRKSSIYIKFLAILNGFTPSQFILFNLKNNNKNDYIREIDRFKIDLINGEFRHILENKYQFYEMFKDIINLPKLNFWINNGAIIDFQSKQKVETEFLVKTLMKYGKLLIKENMGENGRNIFLLEYKNEQIYFDNQVIDLIDLEKIIKNLPSSLIVEYVLQASYSNEIFCESVNTIRIITIQDISSNFDTKIALAMHRFGRNPNKAMDNARAGGIYSSIDIDTGILSYGLSNIDSNIYYKHPISEKQIEGIVIPHWDEIKTQVIHAHKNFPYLKFIAWDIAVTETGLVALEGNLSTGLYLIQAHKGQRNSELGEFYRLQGLIK